MFANAKTSTRLQALQVGEQGRLALQLMAPELRLDPRVKTHVLVELQADGSLVLPDTVPHAAGALAPIHTLSGIPQPPIETNAALAVPRINLASLSDPGSRIRSTAQPVPEEPGSAAPTRIARNASAADLLNYQHFLPDSLNSRLTYLPAPDAGLGQVLRFVAYRGDQLVGGYTMVVTS
jgi:hypothetical protein